MPRGGPPIDTIHCMKSSSLHLSNWFWILSGTSLKSTKILPVGSKNTSHFWKEGLQVFKIPPIGKIAEVLWKLEVKAWRAYGEVTAAGHPCIAVPGILIISDSNSCSRLRRPPGWTPSWRWHFCQRQIRQCRLRRDVWSSVLVPFTMYKFTQMEESNEAQSSVSCVPTVREWSAVVSVPFLHLISKNGTQLRGSKKCFLQALFPRCLCSSLLLNPWLCQRKPLAYSWKSLT